MFEGVNIFVILGAVVGFGGFGFGVFMAVAKSSLATGKLIGEVTTIVKTLTKDVSRLWEHQHTQDTKISKTEKAIERIDTNIDWIKKNLEGKRK